jgi:hypothetical protein
VLLVRVTGRPDAIRAYTAAEQAEAEAYAAAVGGVIEPLPTNLPYQVSPRGLLDGGEHSRLERSSDQALPCRVAKAAPCVLAVLDSADEP